MLKIEVKTPWHEQLLHVVIAIFFVLASIVMFNIFIMVWDRDICGRVPMSEYVSKTAPAKCQTMWKEGRI